MMRILFWLAVALALTIVVGAIVAREWQTLGFLAFPFLMLLSVYQERAAVERRHR